MKFERKVAALSLAAAVAIGMSGCGGGSGSAGNSGGGAGASNGCASLPAWTDKDAPIKNQQDVKNAMQQVELTWEGLNFAWFGILNTGKAVESRPSGSLKKIAALFVPSAQEAQKTAMHLDRNGSFDINETKSINVNQEYNCSVSGRAVFFMRVNGDFSGNGDFNESGDPQGQSNREESIRVERGVTFEHCRDEGDRLIDTAFGWVDGGMSRDELQTTVSGGSSSSEGNLTANGTFRAKAVERNGREDDYDTNVTKKKGERALTYKAEDLKISFVKEDKEEDLNVSAELSVVENHFDKSVKEVGGQESLNIAADGCLSYLEREGNKTGTFTAKAVDFSESFVMSVEDGYQDEEAKKAPTDSYLNFAVDGYIGFAYQDPDMNKTEAFGLYADTFNVQAWPDSADGNWSAAEANASVSGALGSSCVGGMVQYASQDLVNKKGVDNGFAAGKLTLHGDGNATIQFTVSDDNKSMAIVTVEGNGSVEYNDTQKIYEGNCSIDL